MIRRLIISLLIVSGFAEISANHIKFTYLIKYVKGYHMIKLTHKTHIKQLLKDNPNWEVVDLGCGIDTSFLTDEEVYAWDIKDYE
ncbi:MAG: hypothetical protein QF380_07915 [Candidatus Marinimicrobia bacterium]|nr:hypothetical protein [Candidatus Neomarinimicrobiota bacterium]